MIYTGIGSRDTPEDILRKMESVGRAMASWGHTLRSGGAPGADTAFETGCDQKDGTKEIYLPWKFFNKNQSPLFGSDKPARLMAKEFHPKWDILSCKGRDFHARNVYQVLGKDLSTPTSFIICWTKGGKPVGGTSQAIRMADRHRIPVLNFGSMSLDEIEDQISTLM